MKRLSILFFFAMLLSAQVWAATPVAFNPNTRYSREVIDACLYHFNANGKKAGFAQYDANGKEIKKSESERGFDYVPGLVAKAVLEAIDYYQDSAFVKPWYYSMETYGNKYAVGTDAKDHSKSNTLDDLNACKLYFGLSDLSKPGAKFDNATTYANCQTAKTSTLKGLENYDQNYRISSEISQAFCGNDTYTGGWWHKESYKHEMWCDGQYMGPALLAQLLHDGKTFTGKTNTECWDIIARQFTMTWSKLWNNDKKLLYHAFSAVPANDSYWADQTQGAHYGVSAEFWARAEGWYFLALIDVLELMPASHPQYAVLRDYLNQIAQGLVARQDASTGCWCQLLQYANGVTPAGCSKPNYLESSGSALFVAGFLKGQRLDLFDTDYSAVAKKGYQGLVQQFLVKDQGGNKYALIKSCASAGLSEKRKGDANYYLSGSDTGIASPTEGKVLGAFILAAVEYERAYMVAQTTTRPMHNTVSRTYTADNTTNFSNPERGFYEQVEQVVTANGTSNLNDDYFTDGKNAGRSLLLRLYYLDNFRDKELPQAVLNEITDDMAKFRTNGFKCILRFAYTAKAYENASQNQDASPAIWQQHLSQLKPVMAANADVIYVVQAGFLGAWGEWYYSGQGVGNSIPAATKKNLITQLLDAVPANRCVQLRTPLFKTDYMGDAVALTAATAYKGDARSRLGHHNDAFCNGEYNMGTYTNVSSDKAYIAQECLFVPIGGETNIEESNAANYTNYGTGAKAEAEMRLLHYSYLNYSYSSYATDQWNNEKDASGTSYYNLMARQMGYRFVLTEGSFPTEAVQGDKMTITLKINNTGYAPLYNERHAYIVLKGANHTYRMQLQSDPRTWQPAQTTTISESLLLPTDIEAGTYSLYLYLPDADSKIAANPAYAVRFANSDVWETTTGYNNLNTQVVVAEASADGKEDNNDDAQSCNCLKFSLVQNIARSAK